MQEGDWGGLAETVFTALEDGAADRRHGFHLATIATVTAKGGPALRTVVLRAVDASRRTLAFHTDSRSPKVEQLARDPRMAVHFYDSESGLQLRLDGRTSIHRQDAKAETGFAGATLFARRCYLAEAGPGTRLGAPGSGLPAGLEERAPRLDEVRAGLQNFAVLEMTIHRLDWMSLAAGGHRRAILEWDAEGTLTASWVVP